MGQPPAREAAPFLRELAATYRKTSQSGRARASPRTRCHSPDLTAPLPTPIRRPRKRPATAYLSFLLPRASFCLCCARAVPAGCEKMLARWGPIWPLDVTLLELAAVSCSKIAVRFTVHAYTQSRFLCTIMTPLRRDCTRFHEMTRDRSR